jgi:phosphomethylpyrimidine synthase
MEEAEAGMKEMSEKFKQMGSEVYVEAEAVKASNKVF